ncbi:hypothetical protein QVD17_31617 [Tagetes erecta]|uniref:Uncharacterized protein n=1 Tax=Tagetes erecta TaxID=13708 RepID=A0AAD8K4V0_TARER|nr:hypothetical protein QVD17_31617 [Tagetes erecta]
MNEDQRDGLRTRSFRNEDYTNRRVFLKSYPLNFDNDDQDQNHHQTQASATADIYKTSKRLGDTCESCHGLKMKLKMRKEVLKKIMVTILEWGDERVVVIKKIKHKVSFYVVACFPIVFKPPKGLISSR